MSRTTIKNLKSKVVTVLRDNPETRNSDALLTVEIWKRFYSDHLMKSPRTGKFAVILDRIIDLPREDNIKRIRAKLQNEQGIYPPTSLEVAKKRGFSEIDWKRALGYNVNDLTGQASLV